VREPSDRVRRVVLEGETLIGRKVDEGLQLADREVSRTHLRLVPGPEGVQVEDLGSTNGTYVNGRRLRKTVLLRPGDRVDVGDSTLWLRG
jgi:pSer/pThr/pTyr-binding forkhead associated (FHA) protein